MSTDTYVPVSERRTLRVRTVVFGLVMLAIAGTVLVGVLTNVAIDGGAVFLVLLVLAGIALLGGGLAAAVKEAKGGPGA